MTFPLPVNVDTTYADDAGDASVKTHQQHHDSIHARLNQEPSRPEDYGAVGNGTTDDSAAWNSALDAAKPANGGKGFVMATPGKAYAMQARILVPSGVHIVGSGGHTESPIVAGTVFRSLELSQTVTAMTNAGTTVTATVASTTKLNKGQYVIIGSAAGLTNVNGTWEIASIVSGTQFTFVVTTTPTGTYTASSATAKTHGYIQCTGWGSGMRDLQVSGENVAPLGIRTGNLFNNDFATGGDNHDYFNVDVIAVAGNGWEVWGNQNSYWVNCTFSGFTSASASQAMVIDQSASGHKFTKCIWKSSKGHNLKIDQSVTAPPGAPSQPSQIAFDTCILEGAQGDYICLKIINAMDLHFINSWINDAYNEVATTQPIMEFSFFGFITLTNCGFYGNLAGTRAGAAIKSTGTAGTTIHISGNVSSDASIPYILDFDSTCTVYADPVFRGRTGSNIVRGTSPATQFEIPNSRLPGGSNALPTISASTWPVWVYGDAAAVSPGPQCTSGKEYFSQAQRVIGSGTVTTYGRSNTRIFDVATELANNGDVAGTAVAGSVWPGVSVRNGIVVLDVETSDVGHFPDMTLGSIVPVALPANENYVAGVRETTRAAMAIIASESRIEQSAGTFTGTWTDQALADLHASNGTLAYTTNVGAAISFSTTPPQWGPFAGKVYFLHYAIDAAFAIAPILCQVDSLTSKTVFSTPFEQYVKQGGGNNTVAHQVIAVDVPVDGAAHTIKFTHAGTAGQYMYADCLLIPSVNPVPVLYMEAALPVTRASGWTQAQVDIWMRNFYRIDPAVQEAVSEFQNVHWVASNVTANGMNNTNGKTPNDRGMQQRLFDLVNIIHDKFGPRLAARQASLAADSVYTTL